MKVRPICDHFLVVKTQEDVDAEKDRVQKEVERIKEAQQSQKGKPRIITSLKEQNVEEEDYPLIEHKVEFPVHLVDSVGEDCGYVRPGDQFIERARTMPERTIYNGKLYMSFPEKSVSIIVED